MALLPLASGSEARGFWASTAASSIRRVVRRRSPSSASANSWTAQVVSSTRLLIRRSCVQGVIIGRIQGFHAFSIPQDTRKQKLWVTGSPGGEGAGLPPAGGGEVGGSLSGSHSMGKAGVHLTPHPTCLAPLRVRSALRASPRWRETMVVYRPGPPRKDILFQKSPMMTTRVLLGLMQDLRIQVKVVNDIAGHNLVFLLG